MPHVFTSFYPFSGLGLGARGFLEAIAKLGPDSARFLNLGGIDLDPDGCKDFKMLTGAEALCADIKKVTPAQLKAWLTKQHGREVALRRPDCVFTSPPCKGFSRLLGNQKALERKYQELNQLVYVGLFLMCETWSEPPPLIVLENVPGIVSRGKEILDKAQQLLRGYGYVFHRATHDCGEIGGLAQHRKRFLLVARHQRQCSAYVYQPPKKRVRACGEVLAELPIPGGDQGGPLHVLPKISWLNWVRLALIPAGGDWRDLPKAVATHAENPNAHRNKHAVADWSEPAPTVIGATRPGSGAASVADPRPFDGGRMGVQSWEAPAKTVTGESYPSNGSASVADPRLGAALGLKKTAKGSKKFKGSPGLFGVIDWKQASPAVTGSASISGSNGKAAVADPRAFAHVNRVTDWNEPIGTVTASPAPSSGAPAVADPRVELALGNKGPAFSTIYKVSSWDEPTGAVTGASRPGGGAPVVADPRVPGLKNSDPTQGGALGVLDWQEPAKAVTGNVAVSGSNSPGSVADPRVPAELLSPLAEGAERRSEFPKYDVRPWSEPARTVAGSGTNGGFAVADPRVGVNHREGRHTNQYKVQEWEKPARTVTGDTDVQTGAQNVADPRVRPDSGHHGSYGVRPWSEPAAAVTTGGHPSCGPNSVADPRIELGHSPRRNAYEVSRWSEPAKSVRGRADVRTGPAAIADPRAVTPEDVLTCKCRNGSYGVMSWQQAADTITGSASLDNGRVAVADPRKPPDFVPVIIAADGTWHRPLTTLELAALQGMPSVLDGKPLQLAGKKIAAWRERIGNAVPLQAGTAIATSLLKALLASALGTWFLSPSGEPIWVREDGMREDQLEAELGEAAAT